MPTTHRAGGTPIASRTAAELFAADIVKAQLAEHIARTKMLDAIIDATEPPNMTAIAKAAGVARSTLYAQVDDRRAERDLLADRDDA